MKHLLLLFLGLITSYSSLYAQKPTCACEKDFNFIVDYLEKNLPAYVDNVTDKNRTEYEQLKRDILQSMRAHPNPDGICFFFLKNYIQFFNDNHLGIEVSSEVIDENSPEAIQKFKTSDIFQKRERVALDSAKIYAYLAQSTDTLEGIYQNEVYQFALLRNQNDFRDYYGIITQSKTPLWERGQVKLELKKMPKGDFQSLLYMRNHNLQYTQSAPMQNPILSIFTGASKVFPTTQGAIKYTNVVTPPEGDWFQFKELNDSTSYVHIKTFDGSLFSKFDSAYQVIVPKIKQKPYLIIDIRDNGGGSDRCWNELAKLIYTQPFKSDVTFAYATPDIIQRYEEQYAKIKAEEQKYSAKTVKYMEERIALLKNAKSGTFVSASKKSGKPETYKFDKVEKMPQKVVLMFNRNSASAAEGLILVGLNSRKTITFGENSGGYIAYGNIMPVKTPSGYTLRAATQKTPNRVKYEKTGIPPQIRAQANEDWLIQAQRLLFKSN
jgi:hypothetical protein